MHPLCLTNPSPPTPAVHPLQLFLSFLFSSLFLPLSQASCRCWLDGALRAPCCPFYQTAPHSSSHLSYPSLLRCPPPAAPEGFLHRQGHSAAPLNPLGLHRCHLAPCWSCQTVPNRNLSLAPLDCFMDVACVALCMCWRLAVDSLSACLE